MLLKRLHFWVGVIGVLAFVLSGQYMFHVHDHLDNFADGPRMLFRSAHIYLLLTSLINLVMGVYLDPQRPPVNPKLQWVLSIILLLAPAVMLTGFFIEPWLAELQRPYIKIGLYALFAVSVILIIMGFRHKR